MAKLFSRPVPGYNSCPMSFPHEALLGSILSQPTAPFREGRVMHAVLEALQAGKVPHFLDPVGNIVVGVASRVAYSKLFAKKTPEPVRLFIAHMDHPGFHGVRWRSSTELETKWYGGSPTTHCNGAPVWLARTGGLDFTSGTMEETKLIPSGRGIESSIVRFEGPQDPSIDPSTLYGAFKFRAPHWTEGELIYSHVADDLIGVFAILSLALDHFSRPRAGDPLFVGLLTRAEEVGFIGAIGHFELGWIQKRKRTAFCVSLETSKTLPGADIGKGPVVRLGDRMTMFSAGHVRIFSDLAQSVLPDRHQRRVMDGGSCEATAATVYGLPTVGISVPLGNYHNQSFQGGPDSRGELGPAPEFVHREDMLGMIELCQALLRPKLPWSKPFAAQAKAFKKSYRGYRKLLVSGP